MKLDDVKCNICAAVPESDIYSYHVYLFSDTDELCDLWLPKAPEGFLRFSDDAKYGLLSLYAKDGQWVIACRQPAFFLDVPMEHCYEMPLSDGLLLNVDTDEIGLDVSSLNNGIYMLKVVTRNGSFTRKISVVQ